MPDGGLVDTFGEYVQFRLTAWGDEFALFRDNPTGSQKNILQVLIEHKGFCPRSSGYRIEEVDLSALQVERIVAEIAKDQMPIACVLRAYYCGRGRRKVERYDTACELIRKVCQSPRIPAIRQYLGLREQGFHLVRGALVGMAIAA